MIRWEEKYATGVKEIDEQHKKVFAFLNDLEDAIKKRKNVELVEKAIHFLGYYAKIHFNFEEICMAKHHCPTRTKNKADHQRFLKTFKDYETRFKKQGYSEKLLMEIHDWVEEWIAKHICEIDVHLRESVGKSAG